MPLSATLKSTYTPSSVNVNQKYEPFDGNSIQAAGGDAAVLATMANNRITAFTNLGVQVNRLVYLGYKTIDSPFSGYALGEVGKSPPLAVVSSNRSRWIKERYEMAKGILE